MTRRGRRTLNLLVLLAVATTTAAEGLPAIAGPEPVAVQTGRARVVPPETRRCGIGDRARCGRIRVPLDHADPAGPTIPIAYQRYPRLDRDRPSLGTIVAIQGGPGYSTLNGDFYYHELYRPLLRRRSLLMIDLRGTGRSRPIDCSPLQTMSPARHRAWVAAVGACGRSLGAASSLYTTAQAADDLALILDRLGIAIVDLYGDSYGTYFAQSFATRHPGRVRSLVLDSAYPAGGDPDEDPWATSWHGAILDSIRRVCTRDAACSASAGGPIGRLGRLNELVTSEPIVGMAPDGNGRVRRAVIDPDALIALASGTSFSATAHRELDAAVRAALPPSSDPRPLLRRIREMDVTGGGGAARSFSYGLFYATTCTDYPQLFDMQAAPSQRRAEYAAARAELEAEDPGAFAPWSVPQWTEPAAQDYDSCLRWPRSPTTPEPPIAPGAEYPDVPVLVLAGDLDSVTSPEDAQIVADLFPDATYVEVPNRVHITALADDAHCVSAIVQRFTRKLVVDDTSCLAGYAPIRAVDRFVRRVREVDAPPRRRVAIVAADTVADVAARWWEMWGTRGSGLRGGSFVTWGWNKVGWKLDRVRWAEDLWVDGRARWWRLTGEVTAKVEVGGRGGPSGHLRMSWNDMEPGARATVRGRLGGQRVSFDLPAP